MFEGQNQESYAAQAQTCDRAGAALGKSCRQTLRDKFASQLHLSLKQGQKAQMLQELTQLLDKNPEIARILDLVDALGNS